MLSLLFRNALTLTLVGLVACGGGKDEGDTDTTTNDGNGNNNNNNGDTTPTGDPGPSFYSIDEFEIVAWVAWDAELGQVVQPIIDGDKKSYISGFQITISESGGSPSCGLVFDWNGYTAIPTEDLTEGHLFGIEQPQGSNPPLSNCVDVGFDPAQFEEGGLFAGWENMDVKLQLSDSELPSNLEEWITPATTTDDFSIDDFMTGLFSSEWFGIDEAGEDELYSVWQPFVMDAEHNVDLDTRVDRFSVPGDVGVQTGYYYYRQSVYWQFN